MGALPLFRWVALGAVVLTACAPTSVPETPGALIVRELPRPAGPRARWPDLALGADGSAHLSWTTVDGDRSKLEIAVLIDGSWSSVETAASGADWFVNWADFPRVILAADGRPTVAWLEKIVRESDDVCRLYVELMLDSSSLSRWAGRADSQSLEDDDLCRERPPRRSEHTQNDQPVVAERDGARSLQHFTRLACRPYFACK